MKKLLIYIASGVKFEIYDTIHLIKSINGMSNTRVGDFIGAVFEGEYHSNLGGNFLIRLSKDCETITISGGGDGALDFALKLQEMFPFSLWMVDMNLSFNLELSQFSSIQQLREAVALS